MMSRTVRAASAAQDPRAIARRGGQLQSPPADLELEGVAASNMGDRRESETNAIAGRQLKENVCVTIE
jgi:hypothetical protein